MRTKQVVVNHNILWGCCFIYFSKIKPLNYAPPSLGKQPQKEESIRACKRRWQVCAQAQDLMTPGAAGRVGGGGVGGGGKAVPGHERRQSCQPLESTSHGNKLRSQPFAVNRHREPQQGEAHPTQVEEERKAEGLSKA